VSGGIGRAEVRPYRLSLRGPWSSAAGSLETRSGWLLRLPAGAREGWGEAAPLPPPAGEPPGRCGPWLAAHAQACAQKDPGVCLAGLPPAPGEAPAARCALECALLDLISQRAGHPLARWLAPGATTTVMVNAALGALAGAQERLAGALAAGYRCLKVKVGLGPPEQELALLRDLAEGLPAGAMLRLDANRAWSAGAATIFLAGLEGLPVQLLEEPLRDPTPQGLAQLAARSPVPLALDESLGGSPSGSWLGCGAAWAILKPTRLGGLLPSLSLARQAREAGLGVVVTSTLETALGVTAAAHLSAALDATGPAVAHGLATADWLQGDPTPAPLIAPAPGGARLALPQGPGLGRRPALLIDPAEET
jgi:o-succinylbenzoate synthase